VSSNFIRAGAVAVGMTCCSILSPIGVAAADPQGEPFQLVCGDQTFSVATTAGRGEFTPAFDIASNKVFVPASFGAFSGQIFQIDGDGNETPLYPVDDSATVVKGSGKQRRTTACTYTYNDTFTVSEEEADAGDPSDPEYLEAGTYRFVGSGSVVGQIIGR
jgi:hypothetical protein